MVQASLNNQNLEGSLHGTKSLPHIMIHTGYLMITYTYIAPLIRKEYSVTL